MVELGVLIVQSSAFGVCHVSRRVIAFPLFALPACWSTFVELTVFGGLWHVCCWIRLVLFCCFLVLLVFLYCASLFDFLSQSSSFFSAEWQGSVGSLCLVRSCSGPICFFFSSILLCVALELFLLVAIVIFAGCRANFRHGFFYGCVCLPRASSEFNPFLLFHLFFFFCSWPLCSESWLSSRTEGLLSILPWSDCSVSFLLLLLHVGCLGLNSCQGCLLRTRSLPFS